MSAGRTLDPELLKAFVAVAERRSFTRAAAALHRTQSAVSMQIRRLEARLGIELFERDPLGIRISAAGEGLLGYARRILQLHQEAIGSVSKHRVEGRVRLGAMDDYGCVLIPPLLASFGAAYPQIRVEMETGLTTQLQQRLGIDLDLLIAMHPEGEGGGEWLCREQAVWAGGAAPAASWSTFEAAEPLPVALYPPGCLFRQWAIEALDAAGRPWRLAFVSHSLAAVEAVAFEGLAVTVVKRGTMPPRLRMLSEAEGLPPLPAADIRLHRAPGLSAAASLLAEHLAHAIRDVAQPARSASR